jgi:hypothetical protein
MGQGNRRDWREICEDVLRERNPEKVNALLDELATALEERSRKGERAARPDEV